MSIEIYWLTLTALMTALFWVPYVLNRFIEIGILPAITNPNTDAKPRAAWAQRMMNAHSNAVENLVVFAALAMSIHLTGTSTELSATAVKVYFFARLAHFVAYSLGVPLMRTLLFLVGFACQMILALTLLGVM